MFGTRKNERKNKGRKVGRKLRKYSIRHFPHKNVRKNAGKLFIISPITLLPPHFNSYALFAYPPPPTVTLSLLAAPLFLLTGLRRLPPTMLYSGDHLCL